MMLLSAPRVSALALLIDPTSEYTSATPSATAHTTSRITVI
jgi:hypothetical protein